MRSYRSSSLGSCTRAQIALQCGYTPLETPDKMQAIYDRGNDHEDECVVAMEADGWWIKSAQAEVNLEVAGAEVTGHLDGVIWSQGEFDNGGADRVLEIKSPQSFHKWERAHKTGDYSDPLMNRYAWQISVYMAATGLEAVVACVEDGQVKTFGIEVAPYDILRIEERVAGMESFVERGLLPTCSQADYPCPVVYLHEKAELEEDEVLDDYVAQYDAWAQKEKFAKGAKANVQKALLDYLGEREGGETASSKVTRYSSTRKSYDYEQMAVDGIDLSKYMTEKASESVRITKKEGGGT